ncbi:MAG: hypothetical protein C4297_01030 [Gemmataceae bacterium]
MEISKGADASKVFVASERNGVNGYHRHAVELRHQPVGWYIRCKYVADRVLAGILLVLSLPILAVAALLIKLTSCGPIIYRQKRLGKAGAPFTIYKLRTMYHNCEVISGPCWATKNDPRITPVGRILRRLHIDELPQLWNVLRGEMSLVGPRPERPEFIERLQDYFPDYRHRLSVRPGMTGLAQVQLPPDSDLDSVRLKLAHDFYYVERLGPWLDIRILLATGLYLLCLPTAWWRRWLRLPGGPEVVRRYEPKMVPSSRPLPWTNGVHATAYRRVPG